jgi:hypothetical protein
MQNPPPNAPLYDLNANDICAANGCPEGLTEAPRDFWIRFVRDMLSWCPIDWLEDTECDLKLAEEDELAAWLRTLRQERQALN